MALRKFNIPIFFFVAGIFSLLNIAPIIDFFIWPIFDGYRVLGFPIRFLIEGGITGEIHFSIIALAIDLSLAVSCAFVAAQVTAAKHDV